MQGSAHLLQQIGTIGVIVFFVIAGALFHYERYSLKEFFTKKILYLALPWVISGTAVYLYVYLRKPPVTFIGWVNYIVGNGSYLYYLTVLVLCYLIFWFIKPLRSTAMLVVFSVITFLSASFFYDKGYVTSYLDIFNWIGYFTFGMLLSRYKDKAVKIFGLLKKTRWLFYAVFIGAVIIRMLFRINAGYWGFSNLCVITLGVIATALFSERLTAKGKGLKPLAYIGDNSLFIYLWHMPIAGITAHLMNKGFLVYGVALRPFIVLLVVTAAMLLADIILRRAKPLRIILGIK